MIRKGKYFQTLRIRASESDAVYANDIQKWETDLIDLVNSDPFESQTIQVAKLYPFLTISEALNISKLFWCC